MSAESVRADKYLFATVNGDPTMTGFVNGRVYVDDVPQDAAYPYVLITLHTPHDVRGVGPARIWSDLEYVVRGVDQTESYQGVLKNIADRLDALLHAKSGSADDGTIFACTRENAFRLPERDAAGRSIRHLGGIYKLIVQVP